ncbi:hypothetical protein MNBD_DELTA04-362 [hydrothermal vent metagenome]|uniref:4Fe-4S ferredoxin-type domain-containing protein n=1 Tax=hydrothermal vent metagenome TaxID=652676 RepID=A0A3B0VD12_9ZZZZ
MSESKDKTLQKKQGPGNIAVLYTTVAGGCIECGRCRKACRFLQANGMPKGFAEEALTGRPDLRGVFACSLCGLCTSVCPQDIDPAAMFAEMRREAVRRGQGRFRRHRSLLGYERWGGSPLLSWYGLPTGCDTVFFPGCSLAGTRPRRILQLYEHLKRTIPSLGVVLDCCTKPSHSLGRTRHSAVVFGELVRALQADGVRNVLVACPSCYTMWRDYGGKITVRTLYEDLAGRDIGGPARCPATVTVHDPCSVRNETHIHEAVRKLIAARGLQVEEMPHHGATTVCCGEGGAAGCLAPQFADNWGRIRKQEAAGRRIITYCAGCVHLLGRRTTVSHILDLFFEPALTLADRVMVARPPLTWLHRFLLKGKLRRRLKPAIIGRRGADGRVRMKSS